MTYCGGRAGGGPRAAAAGGDACGVDSAGCSAGVGVTASHAWTTGTEACGGSIGAAAQDSGAVKGGEAGRL